MQIKTNNHLKTRNIVVSGHRTSVRLEDEMWDALHDIAKREKCSIHELATTVSKHKSPTVTFSTGLRIFMLLYYRSATTKEGPI